MEFYLENNTKKISLDGNVFAVFGSNGSGKTVFIEEIYASIKNKKMLINNLNYLDCDDVIVIDENFDLKKELSLQKKSHLRKNLLTFINQKLEEKQIDLVELIENNQFFQETIKLIDQKMKLESNDFQIKADMSFDNSIDLIDSLIKLKVFKNDFEINEKILSRSEKFQIFLSLFTSTKHKNKIFLFDCPDSSLDLQSLMLFCNLIKKLSINNFIFITFRNLKTFEFLEQFNNGFYFLQDQKINKFFLSEEEIIESYLLRNNLSNNKDIQSEIYKFQSVILPEEFPSLIKSFYQTHFFPFFSYLFFENNPKENYFFTKNEENFIKNLKEKIIL